MILLEYISRLVKDLIYIFFISSIFELFIPDGEMKKYVRVLLGFFIIIVILTPVADLLNIDFMEVEDIFRSAELQGNIDSPDWNDQIDNTGESINNYNKQYIKDYYSLQIEEEIKDKIKSNYPDLNGGIRVILDDNLNLERLKINLKEENSIDEIKISPIEIKVESSNSRNEPIDKKRISENKKLEKIQKDLAEILQIDSGKIDLEY